MLKEQASAKNLISCSSSKIESIARNIVEYILDVSVAGVDAEENIAQQSKQYDKLIECQDISSSIFTFEDIPQEHITNSEHLIDSRDKSIENIVEEISAEQLKKCHNTIDLEDKHENLEHSIDSEDIYIENAIEEMLNIDKQKANIEKNIIQQSDCSVSNSIVTEKLDENDEYNKVPYYVVEKVQNSQNVQEIQDNLPTGRGIYDIAFFMKELKRFWKDHQKGVTCTLDNIHVTKSTRFGLRTLFTLKCAHCHVSTHLWSEPKDNNMLDINTAATAATVTAGIGFLQLEELFTAMNIPCMSEKTYIRHRESLVDQFEKASIAEMIKAGKIEKQLAFERNETVNGIPYITVIVDGCWAKRSYGTGYNSLSGIGAIVGYRTQKVLYVGIRNKYCAVCDMAERRGIEPRTHKCYKNFDYNAPSTSMESDAIVEGFKCSIEMHGLIYKTVIADGDSSVYQSILDNKPYQQQMVTVKKIQCVNHLLRNLSRKLKAVSEMTLQNRQRNKTFVKYRNIVKSNMKNIRDNVIEAAAARRAEKSRPLHEVATELQKDILNIPSHVFGEHKRCNERGRTCVNDGNKENYVPNLKLFALYQKVEAAVKFLSCYSESLILNHTNNPAEWFNSIICKVIAGKRINFGARGSYNARIAGAVLQHNTQQALSQIHESMCNSVPTIVENIEKRRQRRVSKKREYRKVEGTEKKFKRQVGTDRYYGPQSQREDLSSEAYEQLKIHHMDALLENGRNWQKIEYDTREQNDSDLWHTLRKQMLTASNFGVVCRMRATTSCATTVKNILYPPYIDTAAIKYGQEMEEIARKELAVKINKEIKKCGLFIDKENPCLGASPDGLIDEDGLVEIKCPLSAENLTAEEAIKTLPQLKNIFDKKDLNKINRTHKFFYQIQGQLNITQRDYCIFVVWTPKSIKTVYVQRDDDFWKNQMLPKLTRFYYECMLPEIVDSRHNRHMPIRNPNYIVQAQEKAREKVIARKKKRQENMKEKNIQNKRLKYNNSLTEAKSATYVATCTQEQDEDCIITSHFYKDHLTEAEITSRRKLLDEMTIPLSAAKDNILPKDSTLDDASLDLFLRVIKNKSSFETQSVHYIESPKIIAACSKKSVQIIGGRCTGHWRCLFFDEKILHIYDSLAGCTYERLAQKEKDYIAARFPQIIPKDIIFERVQAQPDSSSCGIYAAAFATDIVLSRDPCKEHYSNDVECMRRHLYYNIIEKRELLPFPRQ